VKRRLLLFSTLSLGLWGQATKPLTILHTNDLHARLLPSDRQLGGFAQVATLLRREREGCRNCLTLDAGDMVQGTPVSTMFRGLPVYEIVNAFGYDASTLGNHEFDYGWQRIKDFERTAKFPVLNANVVDQHGRTLLKRNWLRKKVGGIRVGIVGVLMENLAERFVAPDKVAPYRVTSKVDVVRRFSKELDRQCDLLIVLAHISPMDAEEILRMVPEIDLVINGHDHSGQKEIVQVTEGRPHPGYVVRSTGYGVEVGRLDLDVDVAGKRIAGQRWKKLPVDAKSLTPATDVAQLVASWEGRVAERVETVIGEAKRGFLTKAELQPLVERAIAEQLGVDIVYYNLGGLRDVLPAGPIRERAIWNILPFDNVVVWGKFKGSQLPAVARKGRQIDPDREYSFAVTDFTASTEGAPGRPDSWGITFPSSGPEMREILIDWIKKKKIVE
jgi:5'-nucleotidase/UDP-sugar diphosphatase